MKLDGCIALVTGANRGLGRAISQALLRAGARKVYAGARDIASITDLRVTAIKLDITNGDDIKRAANACGDINVLINNAGVMTGTPALGDQSSGALRREFEVNVMGLHSMVTAFAPILECNGGGAIANMVSGVSWYVYPFNATYCASKHAALALTDGVRIQLRSKGTVVSGVYAGFIDTDMAAEVSAEKVAPSEVANRLLEGIEDGAAHVCTDEYSKALFATLFANPASVERDMQIAWDSGNAWAN